jgi:hypothetical protein
MKKNLLILLVFSVMNLFSVQAQEENNMVTDGGFEEAVLGETSAAGWWFNNGNATATATFTIDTIKHSGENGLTIEVTDYPEDANPWDIQAVASNITVEANTFYRYTIWAKTDNLDAKVNFTVGITADPWSELGRVNGQLTKKWQKIAFLINSQENTAIRPPIHFASNGKSYIDDLSIIQSNIVGAQASGSGDTLTVDFGLALNAIPSPFNNSAFNVKIGFAKNDVVAVTQNSVNKNLITLTLANKIVKGDSVSIDYKSDLGNLVYTTPPGTVSNVVESFTGEAVENLVILGPVTVNDISLADFSVYPNPVDNILCYSGSAKIAKVEITNLNGQRLLVVNNPAANEISVSRLQGGVYFLSVYGNDGSYRNLKFIKK